MTAGVRAYDETNGRYIVEGVTNVDERLFTIDSITGSVVWSPVFPVGGADVREIRFDSPAGVLYGIFFNTAPVGAFLASIDQATGVHSMTASTTPRA